ncbi:MAG: apolipoprotein N-acyltransferase [Prochloraceae cyanobacterium]|nr:apolipoprotein N-acyltransferase [Prochloraceae cyanobacterium]
MKKIVIALIGGMLMGLTPAPVEFWPLAWFALIPLWILIRNSSTPPSPPLPLSPSPLLLGLAWGCGYHGLALFWITGVHPMTWMGVPWLASLAIALFCWIFITLWGAATVVIWSVGMSFFNKSKIQVDSDRFASVRKSKLIDSLLTIVFGVALWCGLEYLWSLTPLWWTSLSYTQSPHNLAILQLSQISGPSTITAIIVAINGLFAEAIIFNKQIFKLKKQFFIVSFTCLIILHITGFLLYIRPVDRQSEAAIEVGIIQGNIPNEIKLESSGWRKAMAGYTKGYETLADRGVDIILTPETALPYLWDSSYQYLSFYQAILDKKVPAWVGTFAKKGDRLSNTLFTITGTGDIFSRYDKVTLVPLGEFIPFESILGDIVDILSPLDARRAAGDPNQIFDTPVGRAMVGICYDSAFSEHFRRQAAEGGKFIITASNNAHYSDIMPAQHHAQDVMRAIETDRWAARATNTGYSAIVDPRGRTLWISGINTYELHADTIYRRQTKTLYVRWGDWLTVILLIFGVGSWVFKSNRD